MLRYIMLTSIIFNVNEINFANITLSDNQSRKKKLCRSRAISLACNALDEYFQSFDAQIDILLR